MIFTKLGQHVNEMMAVAVKKCSNFLMVTDIHYMSAAA